MNVIVTVLEVVVPIFAVAAIGFGWVKLGYDYPQAFITRLSMLLAMPCLVFVTLARTELSPETLGTVLLAAIVAHVAIGLAMVVLCRIAGLQRETYLAPLIFGNTGNLGLPLALFAFGQPGLEVAIVIFAVSAVGSFTYGVWVVSGGGRGARVLLEPIVLSCFLGAAFLLTGWDLPPIAVRTLDLIGQPAIPLMLLTLGAAVSRLAVRDLARPLVLSLLKLVICVAAAIAVARGFGLGQLAQAVLVLQMIAPVAVTGYLIALRAREAGNPEEDGPDPDAVAGLVVISTLLSVISLPLVLGFLVG